MCATTGSTCNINLSCVFHFTFPYLLPFSFVLFLTLFLLAPSPSISLSFSPPQDLVGREDNDVVIHVIDKDLARTFPSHVLFAEKGSQGYVPFPFTPDKSVISDIHIHCVHVQLQITFMYQNELKHMLYFDSLNTLGKGIFG